MATKSKYHKNSFKIPFAQNVLYEINEISNLIEKAIYLLEIKKFTSIYLFAYHKKSENALLISKILKQKYPKLYEIISIKTIEKFYHYEPLEEGLVDLYIRKKVSSIIIQLTFYPTKEEITNPGCQINIFNQRTQYQNPSLSELYEAFYKIQQNPKAQQYYSDYGYNEYDDSIDRIEYQGKNSIVEVFRNYIIEFVLQNKDIYGLEMNFQIPPQIQQQRDGQNNLQSFQIQQQNQDQFNNNRQFVIQQHLKYSQNFNNYNRPDEDGFEEIHLQGLNQNPAFNQQNKLPNDGQQLQQNEPINFLDNQLEQNLQSSFNNETKQSSGNIQNSIQCFQEDFVNSNSLESETMKQKSHKNRNKKDNWENRGNRDDRDNMDNRKNKDNWDDNRDNQDNRINWGCLGSDDGGDNQDNIDNQDDRDNQDNSRGRLRSDNDSDNQDDRNDLGHSRSNDDCDNQDNIDNRDNRNNRRDNGDIRYNRRGNRDNRDNRRYNIDNTDYRDNRNNYDNTRYNKNNRDNRIDNREDRDKRNNRGVRDNGDNRDYNMDNRDNRNNRDYRRDNIDNRQNKDRDYKQNNKKWNNEDNRDQEDINDQSESDKMDNSQSSNQSDNSMDSSDNTEGYSSNEEQRDKDKYDYKKKGQRKIKFNPFVQPNNFPQNEIQDYEDKRDDKMKPPVNQSIKQKRIQTNYYV